MSESVIALIAAIFGGVGLKVIEKLLGRKAQTKGFEEQLRNELRADIESLRRLLVIVQEDLDEWKTRYYRLLRAYNELKLYLIVEGRIPKDYANGKFGFDTNKGLGDDE